MATAPLMRALRVGKLTYAALSAVLREYLSGNKDQNPVFNFLTRTSTDLQTLADRLLKELSARDIDARIIDSQGQTGGGTQPLLRIKSFAEIGRASCRERV